MTKKEIAEIRKQFVVGRSNIVRTVNCHVSEGACSVGPVREFARMPEEECEGYLGLFQKALSGSIGKNLFSMEFPPNEQGIRKEDALAALQDSKLCGEDALARFFESAADTYACGEDYEIILAYGIYDVPGGDLVYRYTICCFCPVSKSKPGLSYDRQRSVSARNRELWVEAPRHAFLYPAFDSREENLHGLLYFAKKAEGCQTEFLETLVGKDRPLSQDEEKARLSKALAAAIEGGPSFSSVREIQDTAAELIIEDADGTLGKRELKGILYGAGFSEGQAEAFGVAYDESMGDSGTSLRSLTDTKALTVKAGGLQIKADPQTEIRVETVRSRLSLVIPVDSLDAEVNGILCRLREDG